MYVSTARGFGDAQSAAHTAQAVGGAVTATATSVLGMLTAGGSVAPILGITAAAVPVIGAGLMAATLLAQYLIANSGCGQTCIVTSQWANQAADALQQVMDSYFALPAPRTDAQKAVAIANFTSIWNTLKKMCSDPSVGDAGKRCISDRQQGACVWKQAYDPTYPGQPNKGECWNWFNGYLKPIQDDKTVPDATVSDAVDSAAGSIANLFGGSSTPGGDNNLLPLGIVGGLLLLWVIS